MSYKLLEYRVQMKSALSLCRFSIQHYLRIDFLYWFIQCIVDSLIKCQFGQLGHIANVINMLNFNLSDPWWQKYRKGLTNTENVMFWWGSGWPRCYSYHYSCTYSLHAPQYILNATNSTWSIFLYCLQYLIHEFFSPFLFNQLYTSQRL